MAGHPRSLRGVLPFPSEGIDMSPSEKARASWYWAEGVRDLEQAEDEFHAGDYAKASASLKAALACLKALDDLELQEWRERNSIPLF